MEKKTINLVKANLYAVIGIIPIGVVYFLPFYFLWGEKLNAVYLKEVVKEMDIISNGLSISLIVTFTIIFGIVLHEFIHGITWSFYAKNGLKSMKFGILLKMLTPYCHCKEPLKVKHYILGAIMPFSLTICFFAR